MMTQRRGAELAGRTKRFALEVIRLYSRLPKSTEAQVIGRQMLRSGTSVGAQYREAVRAKSVADFISKIEGSLQELEETQYWFELLDEGKIFADSGYLNTLMKEADELISILVSSARTAKSGRPGAKQ
jgi:four helix bundle protein